MKHCVYVSQAAVLDANRGLAYALQRRGIRVTVAAPFTVSAGASIHRIEPASGGLEVVGFNPKGNFRHFRLAGLVTWLRQKRPDAVFVETDPGTLLVEQALWGVGKAGGRVACSTCEVYRRNFLSEAKEQLGRGRVVSAAARMAVAALERRQFRKIDALFCYGPIPHAIYRESKSYIGRVIESPLGVDVQAFYYAPNHERDDRLTVAYLGRMSRRKSIESMVDACAGLMPRPRLMIDELYWEADPSYRDELRRYVRSQGFADDDVEYFCPSHSEVPSFVKRADIVVLTPHTAVEQYGRAIAEAMAMGKPVIVSRNGHLPHLVGNSGIVVPVGDTAAIAAAINRLRSRPVYDQMSRAVRSHAVTRLSIDVQADLVCEWINER